MYSWVAFKLIVMLVTTLLWYQNGFGPKRVLCDCFRCRAMAKQQSTMLIFYKKADGASA